MFIYLSYLAICNRKTNPEGACKSSLIIKNRDRTYKIEYSEGDCQTPNHCVCKSNNFYGKRGTCEGMMVCEDRKVSHNLQFSLLYEIDFKIMNYDRMVFTLSDGPFYFKMIQINMRSYM